MDQAAHWVSRESRSPAWVKIRITTETGAGDGVITNISTRGCRIRSDVPLHAGQQVLLRVQSLGTVAAQIRWSNGRGAGAAFVAGSDCWNEGDDRRAG